MREGGTIKIEGQLQEKNGKREMKICFEDSGKGISQENLEKIYTPFFTTGQDGEGTGLGLWITKMLVEKMEGRIEAKSKIGEGTVFTLYFPVSEKGIHYGLQEADSSD